MLTRLRPRQALAALLLIFSAALIAGGVFKYARWGQGFDMVDFHGWEASAVWEDVKFGMKHLADIERIAMVGEKRWQRGMAIFSKPFIKAEVRYFDHTAAADARQWLAEG